MAYGPERRDPTNPLDAHTFRFPNNRSIMQTQNAFDGKGRPIGILQHYLNDPTGKAIEMARNINYKYADGSDTPIPNEATIWWNFKPKTNGKDQENDDFTTRFLEYKITPEKSSVAVNHPFRNTSKIASFHAQEGMPLRAFMYAEPKQFGDIPEFDSDENAIQFLKQRLLDTLENPKHSKDNLSKYQGSKLHHEGLDPKDRAIVVARIANLVQMVFPDNEQQRLQAMELLSEDNGLNAAEYAHATFNAVRLSTTKTLEEVITVQSLTRTISNVLGHYQESLPKNVLRCDIDFDQEEIRITDIPTGPDIFFYEDDETIDSPTRKANFNDVIPVYADQPNGYAYIFKREGDKVHATLVKGENRIQQYSIIFEEPNLEELREVGLEINSDFAQVSERIAPVRFESPQGNLDTTLDAAA